MTLYALDRISPTVSDSAWIAPCCHVIGKVTVADRASVWFGTTIRGDNEMIWVGEGSNVRETACCTPTWAFH